MTPPAQLAEVFTVERIADGRYQVTGGAEPHVVTVIPTDRFCDCLDFRYRRELAGEPCKHITAVATFLMGAPLVVTAAAGPGLADVDVPPADAEP